MKNYRVYQVDSFTKDLFRGNPAGVVSNADNLSATQMQEIAREMNNSETAFILSPATADHEVWVRFFTPTTEVPICGHATIAAHYVRALELGLPSRRVLQKTGAGILPVEIIRGDGDYRIVMTQGAIEFDSPLPRRECNEIVAALGLCQSDLDEQCPIEIVSTGHSKVLIGIKEKTTLNQIQPNLANLSDISRRIRCNGFFVFTLLNNGSDVLSHGRMFAPAIGIAEDPVTGNANGPLGAYLVHHHLVSHDGRRFSFRGQQGEAIGRLGTVEVTVDIEEGSPRTVHVGGHAVIVFKSELVL